MAVGPAADAPCAILPGQVPGALLGCLVWTRPLFDGPSVQCVADDQFGCETSANCCDGNKCQRQTDTATSGQCKQVRQSEVES